MRERQTDENGNDVPFTDFLDYNKLIVLIGYEPNCNTRAGKITAWRDAALQPSYDEIEAVTDEAVQEYVLDRERNELSLENLLIRIEALEALPQNRA